MMTTRALAAAAMVFALAACSKPAEQAEPAPKPATPLPATPAGPSTDPTATASPEGGLQGGAEAGVQGGTDQWMQVANAEDQDRIARYDDAWRRALREADREYGAQIDTLGLLAVKDVPAPTGAIQPPPGKYRCRTVKIGSMSGDALAYVAYGWFNCTVELTPGGDLILTKTTGSQRTKGLLYPDESNPNRLIYIGAQAWGDEKTWPAYGENAERDQVGVFQKLGENRWRLALPWPKQEAKLELLELKR